MIKPMSPGSTNRRRHACIRPKGSDEVKGSESSANSTNRPMSMLMRLASSGAVPRRKERWDHHRDVRAVESLQLQQFVDGGGNAVQVMRRQLGFAVDVQPGLPIAPAACRWSVRRHARDRDGTRTGRSPPSRRCRLRITADPVWWTPSSGSPLSAVLFSVSEATTIACSTFPPPII